MSEDTVARLRMLKTVTSIKMIFSGTYEELQDDVKLIGIYGEWRDLRDHK